MVFFKNELLTMHCANGLIGLPLTGEFDSTLRGLPLLGGFD